MAAAVRRSSSRAVKATAPTAATPALSRSRSSSLSSISPEEDVKSASKKRKSPAKASKAEDGEEKPVKAKETKTKKRKTVTPLNETFFPERYHDSLKLVGAHTSSAGGAQHAVLNSYRIGGRAFGIFTKNQRQWAFKPLEAEAIRLFGNYAKNLDDEDKKFGDGKGLDTRRGTVSHCSYLVNLASPVQEEWDKSAASFVEEAQRCDQLGIGFLVFHPGSTKSQCTKEEAFASIAKGINRALAATKDVCILVENMAHGTKNMVGNEFADIAAILKLVDDPARTGCCFDTCHAFAAGYDMRTPDTYDATMTKFDETVGLANLKAVHCNDSKADLGAHRDLHQNIGLGFLGLRAFALLMSDKRLDGRPIILETPMLDGTLNAQGPGGGVWQNEIKLLYRLEQLGGRSVNLLEDDAEVSQLFGEIKVIVEFAQKAEDAKKAEKKAAKANGADKSAKGGKGKGKKAAVVEDEDEEVDELDED